MTILRIVVFLILINLIFQSCNQENAFDCVKSTGSIKTEERTLAPFHTLILRDNINLQLDTTSIYFKATVEAGENILPKIGFEQKNDTLFISNKNTCNWVRSTKDAVTVTVGIPKEYLSLIHEGYGTITSNVTLNTTTLEIFSINAGGNIDIQVQTQSLTLYSNSHSLINVSGTTENAFMWINKGIGRMHTENLQTNYCTVKQGGNNVIRVFPIRELNVEILQSGDVMYYHEPAKIISSIKGTGKLIKK